MRSFVAILAFIAALAGVALLPSSGSADGCFKNRGFYSTYKSYAPSYSYAATAYVPTYYPKAVEVLVNPDYYYSLNGYYRDKAQADAIVGRIAEMLLKQGAPQTQPMPQTQPPVQPMEALPNKPEAKPPEPGASSYQEPRLLAVVQRACASCHGPTPTKGATLPLLTKEGRLTSLSRGQWYEAFSRVSINDMPKGGKPLSDEETTLFLDAAVAVSKVAQK